MRHRLDTNKSGMRMARAWSPGGLGRGLWMAPGCRVAFRRHKVSSRGCHGLRSRGWSKGKGGRQTHGRQHPRWGPRSRVSRESALSFSPGAGSLVLTPLVVKGRAHVGPASGCFPPPPSVGAAGLGMWRGRGGDTLWLLALP